MSIVPLQSSQKTTLRDFWFFFFSFSLRKHVFIMHELRVIICTVIGLCDGMRKNSIDLSSRNGLSLPSERKREKKFEGPKSISRKRWRDEAEVIARLVNNEWILHNHTNLWKIIRIFCRFFKIHHLLLNRTADLIVHPLRRSELCLNILFHALPPCSRVSTWHCQAHLC